MLDFHLWWSITGRMEECTQCGVVAPGFPVLNAHGVSNEHHPLPRFCPGPLDGPTHIFDGTQEELVCVRCSLIVPKGTMPNEMTWDCNSRWQVG